MGGGGWERRVDTTEDLRLASAEDFRLAGSGERGRGMDAGEYMLCHAAV